jgi:hypothetical protein
MGTVIKFPERGRRRRVSKSRARNLPSATIVILPVIRIERVVEQPAETASRSHRRRRRRRASHI